ncbi:MAG TPA: TetR/AcrR family transcriptional regulator [Vicinamibacterales bacterium]|nr:TetR/AcrR family transcriptional regulator [Vicinamibacterales bacterium]
MTRRQPTRAPARPVRRPSKRDAILDAATVVFAERGFFAAQVADVARRAGVAAGTVYLYFKNKDDLLISLFNRTMIAAIEEGRELLTSVADPAARLQRFAELHLARLGRDRHLAIVFQVELRQSTKFMAEFSATRLREYLGLIRDTMALGQARGDFRTDLSPTFAAKLLFGALDEMATNWILSNRTYALEADAARVVDVFVRGVQRQSGVAAGVIRATRP